MDSQKIKEYFKNIKEATSSNIIELLENDQKTIGEIIDGLMGQQYNSETSEVIYSNLFNLYQNGSDIQKAFVLHFLPALVWEYLFVSSNHGKKGYGKLEAVLLAIYNAEVLDENGETRFQKFRLPSLSQPSLYHEPSLGKSSMSALTESALSRHEQSEVMFRLNGPGHQLSRVPACHRFAVIAHVLEQYNLYIAFMGESSLEAACKMALRTASCGFKNRCENEDDDYVRSLSKCSRIPLDNGALIQLVYIVYYAVYNGFSKPAIRAFEALHFRAAHGLFSQAYQLTLSIEHLLQSGDRQSLEGPLGLKIRTTLSKSVSTTTDSPDEVLPRCLDTSRIPWKRRCPYEILIAEKSVPSKVDLDAPQQSTSKVTERKLKLPKDSRPKKAKSWANVSSGKPSPTASSAKSPGTEETARRQVVSLELSEVRTENIELLTGV